MRTCHFCERWFKSKQAVRGHLRTCSNYKHALSQGHVRQPRWQWRYFFRCESCLGPLDRPVMRGEMAEQGYPVDEHGRYYCPACFQEGRGAQLMECVERVRLPARGAAA